MTKCGTNEKSTDNEKIYALLTKIPGFTINHLENAVLIILNIPVYTNLYLSIIHNHQNLLKKHLLVLKLNPLLKFLRRLISFTTLCSGTKISKK